MHRVNIHEWNEILKEDKPLSPQGFLCPQFAASFKTPPKIKNFHGASVNKGQSKNKNNIQLSKIGMWSIAFSSTCCSSSFSICYRTFAVPAVLHGGVSMF